MARHSSSVWTDNWQHISNALNITLWILQTRTAAIFLFVGSSKFDPTNSFWIQLFSKVGIGQWFRYFTGGIEVVCAILLLFPKASAIGAALLACTMAGAIVTRLLSWARANQSPLCSWQSLVSSPGSDT